LASFDRETPSGLQESNKDLRITIKKWVKTQKVIAKVLFPMNGSNNPKLKTSENNT